MVIDFEKQFKLLLIQQDEPTFNDFYLQTVDIFYRYLRVNYNLTDVDMQDIVADFYVKCRNGMPKFTVDSNFSGYIWTIFKNTLKDFWKKKEMIPFSSIWADEDNQEEKKADFEESLIEPEDILQTLNNEYTFEQIHTAMQKLDEASQEVIFLRFIEEKDYAEIAKIQSLSQEAIRQKCSRGLKLLKQLLNAN